MSLFDIFDKQNSNKVLVIPIQQISPSPYQPRLKFDEAALQELQHSISENGLIQPITVRKVKQGYEIIAGERRYRACVNLGLKEVPCYIMSSSEEQAAQMAIVENIQRENLSAIEEAKSYRQLMKQMGYTQEEIAQKVGKSQSAIANKIRLLNLPEKIQDGVIEGKISERHARAMLSVKQEELDTIYQHILENQLTVAQTEVYIQKKNHQSPIKKKRKLKGFTRNTKIAINTINQSIKMIENMGIHTTVEQRETEDELTMIIHFPKNG